MVQELLETQAGILRRSALAVRVGGLVVYATCSLLKSESEEQVARFMASTNEFEEVHAFRTMPDEVDEDGFYVAVLRRIA
jgi:16S rRNA (cytosine967-C5)-methyltransferase